MKHIRILFTELILPILTLGQLLIGVLASGFSALIEATFLLALFTSYYNRFLPAPVIAFSLALSFEFTKLYLHYFNAKKQVLLSVDNKDALKYTKPLSYILIGISLLATLVFTINTLDQANYNTESIQRQIAELDAQTDEEIENIRAFYQTKTTDDLAPFLAAKDQAEQKLFNFTYSAYPTKRQAELELTALQSLADKYSTEYTTKKDEFSLRNDQLCQAEIASLKASAEAAKNEFQNPDDLETDNSALAQFISVVALTFSGQRGYSRTTYILACATVSLIISIVLEMIISFSAHLLTLRLEDLTADASLEPSSFKTHCQEMVLTGVKALLPLTAFILIATICSVSISSIQLLIAFLSASGASYIMKHVVHKLQDNEPTANESTSNNLLTLFLSALQNSIIQGSIAFFGYIILGLLFGKAAVELDLPTIAIGIGSALSCFAGITSPKATPSPSN